jgi:hypothetical protein
MEPGGWGIEYYAGKEDSSAPTFLGIRSSISARTPPWVGRITLLLQGGRESLRGVVQRRSRENLTYSYRIPSDAAAGIELRIGNNMLGSATGTRYDMNETL